MPDFIGDKLPAGFREWLMPLLSPAVLLGLSLFSVLAFVASIVGVPYFLCRLPADYFSRRELSELGIEGGSRPSFRLVLQVLRNLLGFLLILLGIVMLVLPGQALITIVIGAFMMDFPGKRRFERWVIARRSVLRAINKLRHRAGKPPLEPRTSWFPPSTHHGS